MREINQEVIRGVIFEAQTFPIQGLEFRDTEVDEALLIIDLFSVSLLFLSFSGHAMGSRCYQGLWSYNY